jgi:hypothetical protein
MVHLLPALVLTFDYQRGFGEVHSDASRVTVLAGHWHRDETLETHSVVEDSWCKGFLANVAVRKVVVVVENAGYVDQMMHDSDVMPDWQA